MFDQVYRYKWFADELIEGPLSPVLNDMAQILFDRGHSRRKVRQQFVPLGQLSRWMRRHYLSLSQLNEEVVKKFFLSESRRVYSLTERGDTVTIRLLTSMLLAKGITSTPLPRANSTEKVFNEFESYMFSEKGMSPSAIYCYKRYSRIFVEHTFGNDSVKWRKINIDYIQKFVLHSSKSFSPTTNGLIVTCLRSFFRFLKMKGYVNFDWSASVPNPPRWKSANLPYFLIPQDLEKLLAVVDRSTTMGKRNYAILLLLARLGLRACEIAALSLDDLDWTNGELILQGKGVKKKRLPISKEVGLSLVEYIKCRQAKSRKLFLRSFPPFEGITKGLVGVTVTALIKQAKLKPFKSGSHLLRHTVATQMLRSGASLNEIGMILGHKSQLSTAIYAKVDFSNLLSVAQPWPLSTNGGV
jgi:site-specific recombinase XerD